MLDDQLLNDYVKLHIVISECWEYRESNVDLNIVNFFNVIKSKITTNGWNSTKKYTSLT